MNKQTIQQIEVRLNLLHKRLTRTVIEINNLRAKRRKIREGRIKQPPPPGIKVMLPKSKSTLTADEFGDIIPSFGPQGD
jgi:hypothetical protein